MADESINLCPHCGARDDNLRGFGPLCVIKDSNYALMRSFFLKEFDKYCCPICQSPRDFQPTIIVVLNEGQKYLYCFGKIALSIPEEMQKEFIGGLGSEGGEVSGFITLDDLRASSAQHVKTLATCLAEGISQARQDRDWLPGGHWREFPSNYFAATALALTTPLYSLNVNIPEELSPEEVVKEVSAFQVEVWISLCGSWSGELEPGRTLEGELKRYFAPKAMLHQAADEFIRVTEDPSGWTPPGRFCVETIRASLHVWRKKTNPRLQEWADLFVKWEVARRVAADEAPPYVAAMEISAERAKETIPYEKLFDACARQFAEYGPSLLDTIKEIADKVGYPSLVEQLFDSIKPVLNEETVIKVEDILKALRTAWEKMRGPEFDPEPFFMTVDKALPLLGKEPTVETLDRVADGLRKILGEGIEVEAHVQAWFSKQLLKLNQPQLVLERIGDQARPEEEKLTPLARSYLWTERSNALRMCRRHKEALSVATAIITDLETAEEPVPPLLRRNLAILYRETGEQEKALEILLPLLPESKSGFRLDLLHSIATTYGALGLIEEAIPYLEEAIRLAEGPLREKRPRILAALTMTKSIVGNSREALSLLREISVEDIHDLTVLLPYASAWLNLLQHPELLEEEDGQRIENLFSKLQEAHDSTYKSGNFRLHMDFNRLLAMISDLAQFDKRKTFWELVDIGAREFEGGPDPLAILALARENWSEGDRDKAMGYLMEIPTAVAENYKPEVDFSLKMEAFSNLERIFEQLVEIAHSADSIGDMRFIAELRRDLLGRIAAAAGGTMVISGGFVPPDPKTIAALGGPTAILEWVEGLEGLYGLATIISQEGVVTETFLSPVEVDLAKLAARINQRLSAWHPGRTGEPFDLAEWKIFEKWLSTELAGHLQDGTHLVVIEHKEVAGLQWHVAAAPRWTTSYAPSWSALLQSCHHKTACRLGPLGLALVPRYGESASVKQSLEISASRTVKLASELKLELKYAAMEACDQDALIDIFQASTLTKLLCHGFVDPQERVVALMVAHDGRVPLADSVAAGTSVGRKHRFSWRDCLRLAKAPPIIFSAACSSGQTYLAGLGERLGLFSALRRMGTRSLVAPRWDIPPQVVLPILDAAMEHYLRGATLKEALYSSYAETVKEQPRWLALSLALEGDWKGE